MTNCSLAAAIINKNHLIIIFRYIYPFNPQKIDVGSYMLLYTSIEDSRHVIFLFAKFRFIVHIYRRFSRRTNRI